MEKIAFIVERLNQPPFSKGMQTMSEFDSKSSLELLDLTCEIVVSVDPDASSILKDTTEYRVDRLIDFYTTMKFSGAIQNPEQFRSLLSVGDKDILTIVIHWTLQKYEHLKKRAYLAKYLMPIDIPPEFLNDDLVLELQEQLKEMQASFKDIHKEVEGVRQNRGAIKPSDLKAEISQLESERSQLQAKIQRLNKEKDELGDDKDFQDMLAVTTALRTEQEDESRIAERLRENRSHLHEAELRFKDMNIRFNEAQASGVQSRSSEELLSKLQLDVKAVGARRETLEQELAERLSHLEKMVGWEQSNRVITEDDIYERRHNLQALEEEHVRLTERLDDAMERNDKLAFFRQASTMAMKTLRLKEEEFEKLTEEKRRIARQIEEKENDLRSKGLYAPKLDVDLKKYGAQVRGKIETYRKMKANLSKLQAELVILQRTEEILKSRHKGIDDFLADLERKRGVEGFRDAKKALVEMSEKAASVDERKSATLEQMSDMVDSISRELPAKKEKLAPLIAELKGVRQQYMEVMADFGDKKATFDKVAVGLDLEKQSLESDSDAAQEECLREESRYHYLNCLMTIAKNKLERANQEKKWQTGSGRMMRDFASYKELYSQKLTQQDQLSKQLRRQQKELKENAGVMTNQKTNFRNLKMLLDAKIQTSGQTN